VLGVLAYGALVIAATLLHFSRGRSLRSRAYRASVVLCFLSPQLYVVHAVAFILSTGSVPDVIPQPLPPILVAAALIASAGLIGLTFTISGLESTTIQWGHDEGAVEWSFGAADDGGGDGDGGGGGDGGD
jgi:hypothetical protein